MQEREIFGKNIDSRLFDLVSDPILLLNTQHHIVQYNSAATEFFELKNDVDNGLALHFSQWCKNQGILDTLPNSLLASNDAPGKLVCQFTRSNGIAYDLHWKNITQSDSSRLILIHAQQHQNTSPETQDSSLLQQLISTLPGHIYWKDRRGAYLGCNNAVLKFAELSDINQLIGKTDYELRWKDRADVYHGHDMNVIRQQKAIVIEECMIRPDGSKAILLSTKKPLINEENQVIGIAGNSIDITDLKKLENELEAAKKQTDIYLKNILDSLPGSIYWKDCDGRYLGCNHMVVKMAQCASANDVIGKTDYELFSKIADKTEIDEILSHDKAIIKTGNPKIYEERWITHTGEVATYLSTKIPLRDDQGNIIGVLGNSVDITERKAEEEARLDSMRALGGSIAHELRTPLGSINSSLNCIQRYLPQLLAAYNTAKHAKLEIQMVPSKKLEIITNVAREGWQEIGYANMIIDMLLVNINQGKIPCDDFTPCSMQHCIEQAISRYPSIPEEEAMIRWKNETDFQFLGKEILMVHVLFNLFKNAFHFIGRSENKNNTVSIWLTHEEKHNVLHFKDTGKGVPADVLPKLFNRFFTTTTNGTGLGLAFCKMVMQAFNGSIECQSKEGEFTEFILRFPKESDKVG